jgi:hypothetical protein
MLYYNIFPKNLILTNKANFKDGKMNINIDITSNYEILPAGSGEKTNPIQTQLKPIQTQFNPIQTQSNPIKANLSKGQK